MKTKLRLFVIFLLALFLAIPQSAIIADVSASGENLEIGDTVSIVTNLTVRQAVNTYFEGRKAFLTSGNTELFVGAVPAMVQDEQLHLQRLTECNLSLDSYVLVYGNIACDTNHAYTVVTETVTYRIPDSDQLLTESISHKIYLSVRSDDTLVVVGDDYREVCSEFSSRSYVDPSLTLAEPLSYGSGYCISEIAWDEVGYVEESGGFTKYGDYCDIPYGDWCAMFIVWCGRMCNVSSIVIPTEAWVPSLRTHYLNRSQYFRSASQGGTHTPTPGDIYFYGNSHDDVSHVGLVVAVSGTQVTIIEGNAAPTYDRVVVNYYNINSSMIVGYATPGYVHTTHTMSPYWEYNSSHHWLSCENCGYQVNRDYHDWVQVGAITRCATCGYNPDISINHIPLERKPELQ